MSKLKFYALMFAVIIGLLTTFSQTAQGQTIINPSFEVDNVPPAPGYGVITGWTGGSGINNATGPFADNGAIPDGQKVAFLQGGTLRQTVSGFTVGVQYRLRYYENRRSATNAANLQVTVGGVAVVATHEVIAVGGTNPYVLKISEPFTATAAALEIAFITSGTGDYTVLLDKIEVVRNLVVTNNLDGGAGSLRQTIIDAPAGGAISFSNALGGTISLATGQIVINKNLTIVGPGADRLTVRNGASSRIFQVNTGVTATISGLTIEDGTSGGISNAGTLTAADCVIRSNKGSGIQNSGNLTVVNSVLSDNEAEVGGAINNTGTAAITNSTILHNSAKTGGGIYNAGTVTITNSSITGNTATGRDPFVAVPPNPNLDPTIFGSAILNRNGRATITNSTIAGNNDEGFASRNCYIGYPTHTCPAGYGTAILMVIDATGAQPVELNLINSTVTDNILRKLFINRPYSVTARNSIINGFADGVLTSQGYNLIVNTFAMTITGDTTGNILNVNPSLAPLGYYGGSTMTHALLTGSPAINAGNTATSPSADQRGAARVGAADIGAFELNNSANGGNFVVQLPDAFTEIAYSHLLVEDGGGSFGGSLPTGFSLSTTESRRVLVSGRTAQTGVFAFSVTATDYRLRVLPSGAPPFGGCRSNVVVANKSDAGEGSLRQVVIDACAGGTITFGEAARGKIHLTGGPIAINKNLTIAGPGADALTLRSAVRSGPQNNVVLVNAGVTAVISGLTVSDGFADTGGGILNSGNLTVRNVVLSNNRGIYAGGAIENDGTLTLDKSLVTGNGKPRYYAWDRLVFVTYGGGILSSPGSSLTITDSTVSGNNANQGGGIYATSAAITNTTISDNSVINGVLDGDGLGGGLYLDQFGMMTLTNCTVSQNYVSATNNFKSEGGGIYNDIGGTLSLINTTVANNVISNIELNLLNGAGISMFAAGAIGTVNARNSIIAGNTIMWVTSSGTPASNSIARQFYGKLTSQGYNLIGSASQIIGVTTGNIVGVDPRLSPLGYYGGPTQTQALLTGSPAINAGNTSTSPATDQRGAARVGTADIGAFELNNSSNGGALVAQLPDGFVQTPYNYTVADFSVSDGRGGSTNDDTYKYSYTVTGGALPNGISLSTTFSGSGFSERENVKVSGTPTQTGIFNFSVTAANMRTGFSSVTNYRLQIYALPNGNFETADCSFISGWAWNPQQPNAPISVNIYADNNLVATVSANQFRQDLLDAGIGNGVHGFSFATPANLKDGQPHQIRVLIVSTMSDINGSPKTITCATPPDLTITKTHTGNFTQGDTGKTYTITVTNSGGTATSGLVSITDALPGGLGATSINGTGWNCNFGNLTCTRNDALTAGGSYPAITLTVNVAANAPGSVTNFAFVSGGGEINTGNNQAADPTTINAAPLYSISGTVKYGTTNVGQADSFISGVNLNATGTASALAISDGSGNYFLSNLLGGNYTVTPTKTGEVRGINSLDATRIQQHLVGITTLTANQLIAADTDGNGVVNSLDATRIQQSLIGMQTPNIIGQWKFAPAGRQYNALGGNATAQDYQAVLIGEVSGNWATAASFAENARNEEKEEENEVTPEPTDQNQIAERFRDNPLGGITGDVSKLSDSSADESLTGTLSPAADIQVSLPANATRSNGMTVTIPITVSQIPAGTSIESFDFSVFYNPAVLQPAATPGSNIGTLSANCSVLPFSPVAGRVIVSGACAQAVTTGSGVLYNLTFNVIGAVNQTSSLSFINPANNVNTFQFNNGTPTVATTNGLFTVLAPTAASVSVSGRVLTNNGRGLMNATVTLTNASGSTRTARTSTFGYFRFDDVEAGQTYIFSVSSKRYSFAPQVVTVTEDLTELNFTAQ